MSLILGISSSSPQFNLLLGENGKILFSQGAKLSMANRQDITMLLEAGLQETGKKINEIEKIIVDIGPGGTSIVRTGVAFANALSYSLNIPVCPVSSLELLCLEAWEKHEMPVITFIKSLKQNVYLGLYNGKDLTMKYGQFEEVVPDTLNDLQELAVVGYNRERLIEAYPDKQIHDSGIQFANPKYLIEQWERFTDKSLLLPNLPVPITEQDI